MNRREFQEEQLRISATAGMNQAFHQERAGHWTWWNRGVQITVAVLAITGLCLSLVAALVEHTWVDVVAIIVAALAAIAAIALNVIPLGDWVQIHRDLVRRWTDIREDIDAMLFDVRGEPTEADIQRLKQLDSKVHRTCGDEPGMSEKELGIFKKFEAAEKKKRHNCISMSDQAA